LLQIAQSSLTHIFHLRLSVFPILVSFFLKMHIFGDHTFFFFPTNFNLDLRKKTIVQ
jgi:hypothetical protein